jgi:hypothetical protein
VKNDSKYFSVTLILKGKPGLDEEAVYDDLINKTVSKNLVVDVSSVETIEDTDDLELDDIDENTSTNEHTEEEDEVD